MLFYLCPQKKISNDVIGGGGEVLEKLLKEKIKIPITPPTQI